MFCAVCQQPMRKMGPDAFMCPAHPEGAPPKKAKKAPKKKAAKK